MLCEHCHLVVRYMHENQRKVETLFSVASEQTSNNKLAAEDGGARSNQVVVMVLADEEEAASYQEQNVEDISKENLEIASESETIDINETTSHFSPVKDVIDSTSSTDAVNATSVRRSSRARKVSAKSLEHSRNISVKTRLNDFKSNSKRCKLSS